MKNMPKLLSCALLLLAPIFFTTSACAKEIAVLLPITSPLTPGENVELAKQAAEGLSGKYDLKHGEEVGRVVKQAFQDESKKKDCDETNCYRKIAAHYHAEKIIAMRVALVAARHYLVTMNVYDVPTGEMTSSQKKECAACSFEKLKGLCKELTDPAAQEK